MWLLYPPGPGPRFMSGLRKRWVIFRHPGAHIEFQDDVYLGPRFSLHMPHGGTFIVGQGVEFRRGFRAEFAAADTRITIGEGSVFTYDALLQCTTSIDIGAHCAFGQASLVVDGNHRFRGLDRPVFEQGYDFRPVVISDHAVIAAKSTVIAASIGERTYVSANTLVGRDIPAFCVVAGIPARIIEYFGPPGQGPRIDRARGRAREDPVSRR
jgi:acetyltransferase-like isoleucine patch superfamily enzyme